MHATFNQPRRHCLLYRTAHLMFGPDALLSLPLTSCRSRCSPGRTCSRPCRRSCTHPCCAKLQMSYLISRQSRSATLSCSRCIGAISIRTSHHHRQPPHLQTGQLGSWPFGAIVSSHLRKHRLVKRCAVTATIDADTLGHTRQSISIMCHFRPLRRCQRADTRRCCSSASYDARALSRHGTWIASTSVPCNPTSGNRAHHTASPGRQMAGS
jgi:hypothetical protein